MSEDIKVGDRFLVEVEVSSDGGTSYLGCVTRGGERNDQFSVHRSVLSAAKRLPRALKVGDRVRHDYRTGIWAEGEIIAIHDEWAWVDTTGSPGGLFRVADLTLAEEAR